MGIYMSQESLTSELSLNQIEINAKKEFYNLALEASKWIKASADSNKFVNADHQQKIKIALQILEIAYKDK
jgi:hypothetical protein